MEPENQQIPNDSGESVGFPKSPEKSGSSKKFLLIPLILVILLVVGAFVFFIKKGNEPVSDTLSIETTPTEETAVETSTPTPTVASVDRGSIKIQVLNGTGVTGGAGDLKTKLVALGYSSVDTGNADRKSYTATQVAFKDGMSQTVKDDINTELSKDYANVTEAGSVTKDYDVVIVTGYPKGYSASPTTKILTATPTPKVTTSVTPSVTTSLSVTPTKTPTPSL